MNQIEKPINDPAAFFKRRWIRVAAFVIGWGVMGTASTLHWRLFRFYDPYTLWELWRIKMVLWYMWGFVTFGILHLSRRYRISRHAWLKNVTWLTFWSLVVSIGYMAVYDIALLINLGNPLNRHNFEGMFSFILDYHSSFFYLAFWATVGIEHAYDYFMKYRERELRTSRLEAQLTQTRLETLKSKIHPHFLFNALNAVSSLVYHKRNDEAYELIARIAELLRHSVKDHDRHEVTLCEELQFVDLYLEIVRIRFRDRLRVTRSIGEDTVGAAVPSLILQPLVENAVKHGLSSEHDIVNVRISSEMRDDALEITISNDGSVLPQDWNLNNSRGFGLASVRERLQNMYGGGQSFELRQTSDSRVEARITIPYRVLPLEPSR